MGLFARLTEKPWLEADGRVVELHASSFAAHNRKVALIVFLCIVGSVFFLLFAATHIRLALATDWVPAPEPPLIWLNSIVLIFVSAALEWTRAAAVKADIAATRLRFWAVGILTLLFLVLQLIVWKQLIDLGYAAQRNPANAFFYVITGVHGVHLLGGLVAWWRALRRMNEDAEEDPYRMRLSVELCALYWHFLLFVWLAMLALFIST